MYRGYYTAASGMLTQIRRQEMITNNIANINTPGYKADQATLRAFPQMLIDRIGGEDRPIEKPSAKEPIGPIATGVYMQEAIPKFIQGDLVETGNGTDAALLQRNVPDPSGLLLFALQIDEGEVRYTRNGNFTVDGAGNLVDQHGHFVLSTEGTPIVVNDNDFTITDNGTIVDDGDASGKINIAYAENPVDLIKEGSGLFRLETDAGDDVLPTALNNEEISYQINQGFLERSNVEPRKAMTELLMSYRTLEANQKVLQAYDRNMEKAVNEIGRIG